MAGAAALGGTGKPAIAGGRVAVGTAAGVVVGAAEAARGKVAVVVGVVVAAREAAGGKVVVAVVVVAGREATGRLGVMTPAGKTGAGAVGAAADGRLGAPAP